MLDAFNACSIFLEKEMMGRFNRIKIIHTLPALNNDSISSPLRLKIGFFDATRGEYIVNTFK